MYFYDPIILYIIIEDIILYYSILTYICYKYPIIAIK